MKGFKRLPSGGRIDRAQSVSFTLDGKGKSGFAGDTLASALLASGGGVIGRSFKYHRPRGVMAAGPEEPNALFTLGDGPTQEPNIPGTQAELSDGLAARTQNGWPSVGFDLMAINQRFAKFLSAGFYYKTFMGPRRGSWMFYEPFIRKAAGLGEATQGSRSRALRHAPRLHRGAGGRQRPRGSCRRAGRGTRRRPRGAGRAGYRSLAAAC